jgi:hypothetical protein
MPFPAPTGSIFLGGVRFSTNPETYEPLNWKKRWSKHPTIGGNVTIQDFGVFMKDDVFKLASGRGQFLDQATFLALHALWRTKGVNFTFTDWLVNNLTVFISDFIPVVFKTDLYTYTMQLEIVAINTLWGSVYTGP